MPYFHFLSRAVTFKIEPQSPKVNTREILSLVIVISDYGHIAVVQTPMLTEKLTLDILPPGGGGGQGHSNAICTLILEALKNI